MVSIEDVSGQNMNDIAAESSCGIQQHPSLQELRRHQLQSISSEQGMPLCTTIRPPNSNHATSRGLQSNGSAHQKLDYPNWLVWHGKAIQLNDLVLWAGFLD